MMERLNNTLPDSRRLHTPSTIYLIRRGEQYAVYSRQTIRRACCVFPEHDRENAKQFAKAYWRRTMGNEQQRGGACAHPTTAVRLLESLLLRVNP
jgi:hypothetical protein